MIFKDTSCVFFFHKIFSIMNIDNGVDNMYFIFIQFLGFIGWLLLVFSYWKKDINKLLYLHLISGIFYALHYFLLDAWAGLCVILIELARDYLYYRTDSDIYIFLGSIPLYIVALIFNFTGIITFLPIIASIVDGLGLAIKKKTAVIGALISSSLWLIYDFNSKSYIGIITCLIFMISNIFVLVKDRDTTYRKVK